MTQERSLFSSPLGMASPSFLESMHQQFLDDPQSVDLQWRYVFQFAEDLTSNMAQTDNVEALRAELIRRRGHLNATLDPLTDFEQTVDQAIDLYLERQLLLQRDPGRLRERYEGTLAIETSHLNNLDLIQWIDTAVDALPTAADEADLRRAWQRLMEAEELERFLMKRFPGKKKFGIEGSEVLLVVLDRILLQAARMGIEEIVIGTMHRGRLNMMANILGKPLATLFAQFKGVHPFTTALSCAADVPYHLGYTGVVQAGDRSIRITLLPNPSHLEAVDSVVLGATRARQDKQDKQERAKVLALILHTDAAVIGQGIVGESIQLGGLAGFSTCGTVHVVVNNQIGFTTEPAQARSSHYCTDGWKAVDSLIMHVNGEDPVASIRSAELAVQYRQAHGKDAVIDLVTYRRNGHNEFDEPRFTQPTLYRDIDGRASLVGTFQDDITASGVLDPSDAKELTDAYRARLQDAYVEAEHTLHAAEGDVTELAVDFTQPDGVVGDEPTGISPDVLHALVDKLSDFPLDLSLGDRLQKQVRSRKHTDVGIPWAMAEALAFGSLLMEGVAVRLSGQDVVRGAFSHRHFGLTDVNTGKIHISLNALSHEQSSFEVINSPLSEYAVLGFEYGYSVARPEALVVWEAQFGDFANGAQIVIDQFITSGHAKWQQSSRLVMLLPHGLEGQGPEHSSARIERYLQLAAQNNICIVNPSTPANYFHVLRRQVEMRAAVPLIVVAPKTLLRLPAAVSSTGDFLSAEKFRPVIARDAPAQATRVLLCSGKIAYELEDYRRTHQHLDVAIVRLEQLYPMPIGDLTPIFQQYPGADFFWVQEEPENMGAWPWYDRKLETLASRLDCAKPRFHYCGRPESASPAGSFHSRHVEDQNAIVARAFASISMPASVSAMASGSGPAPVSAMASGSAPEPEPAASISTSAI